MDAGPLFEALEKKFAPTAAPDTNEVAAASTLDELLSRKKSLRDVQDSGGYAQARVYYLLNLISQGRNEGSDCLGGERDWRVVVIRFTCLTRRLPICSMLAIRSN